MWAIKVTKGTHKTMWSYKTKEDAQKALDEVFDGKGLVFMCDKNGQPI